MHFTYATDIPITLGCRVGNVYPIGGGYGRRQGHVMVVLAITKNESALCMILDSSGEPVSVNQYLAARLDERTPIAFAQDLESLSFTITSL